MCRISFSPFASRKHGRRFSHMLLRNLILCYLSSICIYLVTLRNANYFYRIFFFVEQIVRWKTEIEWFIHNWNCATAHPLVHIVILASILFIHKEYISLVYTIETWTSISTIYLIPFITFFDYLHLLTQAKFHRTFACTKILCVFKRYLWGIRLAYVRDILRSQNYFAPWSANRLTFSLIVYMSVTRIKTKNVLHNLFFFLSSFFVITNL